MSLLAWAGFILAAALGAPARYLVDGAVSDRTGGVFPWGTFAVNATGSFLLGLLVGLGIDHGFSRDARVILGTGFCGAYTTFSTYTFETVRLLEEGAQAAALRNALGTLAAGSLAAGAGLVLAAA